jgi:hypothetical protein
VPALRGRRKGARGLYSAAPAMPHAPSDHPAARRTGLKPDEIRKLDAYFKRTFQNPQLQVKARPRKDDSCEVYLGEEFLGIVFKDDDDGELSYNFSMAILDVDLD